MFLELFRLDRNLPLHCDSLCFLGPDYQVYICIAIFKHQQDILQHTQTQDLQVFLKVSNFISRGKIFGLKVVNFDGVPSARYFLYAHAILKTTLRGRYYYLYFRDEGKQVLSTLPKILQLVNAAELWWGWDMKLSCPATKFCF